MARVLRFPAGARGSRILIVLPALLLGLAAAPSVRSAPGPSHFPDPEERLRLLAKHGPAVPPMKLAPATDQDRYDVRYSFLDIDIRDTADQFIRGSVTHRIDSTVPSLTQVVFDLVDALTVDSVHVGSQAASFTHVSDLITVNLPAPLPQGQSATIRIAYEGNPPQEGAMGLIFDHHNGRAWVWNLSEPDACRRWWPCKDRPDDKADSMDIRITAQDWMTATSNGVLRSTTSIPGARIFSWHESYPIASYLVSVTAGDFTRIDGVYPIPGGGTMPLAHYVFPEQVTDAQEDFNIAVPAINAYWSRFGPYPFVREKYGITVFGWGGGMEHQTNTSYGWFLINGSHTYDWIYVHELSHQWWGDNVTCATWADSWLNEGFASWCEAVYYEAQGGFTAYRNYMTQVQVVYDPSGPIYNYANPFDDNTVYNKGAWAVHMLRGVLGDSVFYQGLSNFRALYQGRSVTTAQFETVMESTSGRDLSWFFNEWIYGMNRPHYVVSSMTEPISGGRRLYVHLDQNQTDAPYFTMPVRIHVEASGGHDYVLFNDPDHEDLVEDLAGTATPVVTVDPDQWILRTVITGPYGLNLITSDLPQSWADSLVSIPLVARGGTIPYTWSTLDPTPPGIGLDPSSGVLSGIPDTPGSYAFRVIVRDSAVPAAADTQRIRWTIVSPADTGTPSLPPLASRLVVTTPNPATSAVLFSLESPSVSAVDWSVYSLTGRRVASASTSETESAGARSWLWGLRDQSGVPVAAGVYWIRAVQTAAGGTRNEATGRVLVVR